MRYLLQDEGAEIGAASTKMCRSIMYKDIKAPDLRVRYGGRSLLVTYTEVLNLISELRDEPAVRRDTQGVMPWE